MKVYRHYQNCKFDSNLTSKSNSICLLKVDLLFCKDAPNLVYNLFDKLFKLLLACRVKTNISLRNINKRSN